MNEQRTTVSPSSPQSEAVIRDFLNDHECGVIATADTAANPYAAVVYYSMDDDFNLTFTTKTETQKYKDMEQNNQVTFVCFDELTQTTVQVSGHVEKVTDPQIHQASINRIYQLSASVSGVALPPIEKLFAGNYVTMRLIPQVIKMGIFLRPDAESNEDVYEILTFPASAQVE
jgi:nitroimidazol reductase NimA-like FMN-containing flavoprotein (pyridoxamine 5'-phosphate oxidase superfamily)